MNINMKVLFIGGTGRLSRDVAYLAADKGYEVYLLTRGSKERKIFVDERYTMLYADITNADQTKKIIADYHFDVVIDFLTFNQYELKRNLKIFDGAFYQYIFISSATVYEKKNEDEVISEQTTLVGNKKWDYAYKKAECEHYLKEYFNGKEEKYTIIRPYVTYSNSRIPYPIITPSSKDEYSIIRRVKMNKPIPVFDDGKTITTLTHTKDFAKGAVGLFMNPKAYGEDFHITSDTHTTWGKVLDCLGSSLGLKVVKKEMSVDQISKSYTFYKDILEGDKAHKMIFDNTKIKDAVPDCNFEVNLEQGIAEVVDFYESHPELQYVDFYWDGRIDRMCKYNGIKEILVDSNISVINKIFYMCGRIWVLDVAFAFFRKSKKVLKR